MVCRSRLRAPIQVLPFRSRYALLRRLFWTTLPECGSSLRSRAIA